MIIKKLGYIGIFLVMQNVSTAQALSNPADFFPTTSNSLTPSPLWLNTAKPYPTNAWFINFMLGQQNGDPSYPVNISPYLMQIEPKGISLSYKDPYFYAEPSHPTIISALYYPFDDQLTLGTKEIMTSYGLASAKGSYIMLQWQNQSRQGYKAPIVQGSPYLTEFFTNATPLLSTKFKLLSVNEQTIPGLIPQSNRYELKSELNLQQSQTWLLYSEHPLSFTWISTTTGDSLVANNPYNGWIRIILQKDDPTGLVNDARILDEYSQNIPLSYGQSYKRDSKHITYVLDWKTQNDKPALILSLPHQRPLSPSATNSRAPITYSGIKGLMSGETTSHWEIELPLPEIFFLEPKKINAIQQTALRKALTIDSEVLFTYPFPDDGAYRVGKRLARAAQLILFADLLNEEELKKKLLSFIEKILTEKMTGKTTWNLEYDTTWGGIIPNVDDYGSRHYNDHHYHYGYWVYTFAVIAQFDPQWINSPLASKSFSPKQWVEILIRDYANPNENDPYFPTQRYQDDYAGHSWASGLSAFVDGQNQQSSSEAVNAYYAIALYGKAIHDDSLFSWGEFLTARELRSAQTYWQVRSDSSIYGSRFRQNNWVIGNLWGSKVDANTFFYPCTTAYRCGLEYSFGIQMLPLNAISEQLLDKVWLKQAYPTMKQIIANSYGPIGDGWRWILIKGIVPVMPEEERHYFLKKAIDSNPNEYDNGDSKTNTLYFLMDN